MAEKDFTKEQFVDELRDVLSRKYPDLVGQERMIVDVASHAVDQAAETLVRVLKSLDTRPANIAAIIAVDLLKNRLTAASAMSMLGVSLMRSFSRRGMAE